MPAEADQERTAILPDTNYAAHRLRIERAFAFQRKDDGWRCLASELQPVDFGVAVAGL